MAENGYSRADNIQVAEAFADFELRAFRSLIRDLINKHSIKSLLDYGSGGSKWEIDGFDELTNKSAKDYFNLEEVYCYEPARNIDQRSQVDCVISFDVLEHIFINDVPTVLRDIFSLATKSVILNIACYPAAALLPNGENAHVTVRPFGWWKGMVDCISTEFPHVCVHLICSHAWRKAQVFPEWSSADWNNRDSFVIDK